MSTRPVISPNGIFAISSKFPAVVSMLFTIINFAWTDVALSEFSGNEETAAYSSALFAKIYAIHASTKE